MGLIDIHTHILPNVDAGCPSFSEAITLLKGAVKDEITDVIITCHYDRNGYFHHSPAYLYEKFSELKNNTQQYPLQLYLGNEILINEGIADDFLGGKCLSLANSRYVLTEFPETEYTCIHKNELCRIRDAGYQVIIAHPERYHFVQDTPSVCMEWREDGFLLQSNAASLKSYSDVMSYLLDENLVSFIASDARDACRPLLLRQSYTEIERRYGKRRADDLLKNNPEKIIKNLPWSYSDG